MSLTKLAMIMEKKTTKKSALYYHHSNIDKVIEEAKQGVCYIVALPFTLKSILSQREIMKVQIFHHAKI
jgi:hypothetical protein